MKQLNTNQIESIFFKFSCKDYIFTDIIENINTLIDNKVYVRNDALNDINDVLKTMTTVMQVMPKNNIDNYINHIVGLCEFESVEDLIELLSSDFSKEIDFLFNDFLNIDKHDYKFNKALAEIRNIPLTNKKEKYIYLIKDLENEIYKIGITKNIQARLNQLKTPKQQSLTCIFSKKLNNAIKHETYLHKKYTDNNYFREWFEFKDDTVSDIISYLESVN